MEEFTSSLRLAFPQVIDVNHLMKEISPLRKVRNIPMATSYLKNLFFAPVDVEIPFQGQFCQQFPLFIDLSIWDQCCHENSWLQIEWLGYSYTCLSSSQIIQIQSRHINLPFGNSLSHHLTISNE